MQNVVKYKKEVCKKYTIQYAKQVIQSAEFPKNMQNMLLSFSCAKYVKELECCDEKLKPMN